MAEYNNKKFDTNTSLVEGRNAVLEAFRAGKSVDKLYIQDGLQDGAILTIKREAKKTDCLLRYVTKELLDQMSETGTHQGVIAQVAAYEYAELDDLFKKAEEKGEAPFFILLDDVEDPHNLGAIIRTANLAGAHGVIIPKNRAVGLTATVARTSCLQGHQSVPDHRRIERTGHVVCLCRYGRRSHVFLKPYGFHRSCYG